MKTWREIADLADKSALARLIEEHGTAPRIARHLGCSEISVRNAMIFHGLQPRHWIVSEEQKTRLKL